MSNITYPYVSHDVFICVTWLIGTWDMIHAYGGHDSSTRLIWLIHTFDKLMHTFHMTHPHVWHDSSTRVTWLIHTFDMTHPTRNLLTRSVIIGFRVEGSRFCCDRGIGGPHSWILDMCDTIHWYVSHDSIVCHDWFMYNMANSSGYIGNRRVYQYRTASSGLQCVTVWSSVSIAWQCVRRVSQCVLHCVAVCCSVWQCVAACCSMLQSLYSTPVIGYVLQCVSVFCNMCKCVAVWCSLLQCVTMWCHSCIWYQSIVVCSSVLHCVALCCSMLQYVAVRYSVL